MTDNSGQFTRLALGAIGIGLFLLIWQTIGHYRLAGLSWPPLTDVIAFLATPSRFGLFGRAMKATCLAFAEGYVIGALLGVGFAALARLLPSLREGADRTAAVVHAIPSIALAPIFIILLSRETTPVAMTALNVFFVSYVAGTSGMEAASRAHHDVMTVFGASPKVRFLRLELPAALPALSSAMRLAVPAGLIGTIIGEWFGAPRGLGLLIVSAMQNFQIPLLWSAVLLAAGTSLTLYGLATLLERRIHERYR